MLVYGHRSFPVHVPSFLAALQGRVASLTSSPPHDALVDLLVDLAEVESGVADALNPVEDDDHPSALPWQRALGTLTDAFCASCADDADTVATHFEQFRRAVIGLTAPATHDHVQARSAEGFSCYALYPEQYVDAARELHRLLEPGAPVVCIGLRSIGSVLAAIVRSELARAGRDVVMRSVRPRGHPFDRQLVIGRNLHAFLQAKRAHDFVVVDEGPGISGSSFAAASDALLSLGVPATRIDLLPAWKPDPAGLRSDRGRDAFARHRVVVGSSPVGRFATEALGCEPIDISAGGWRRLVLGPIAARWPAVHPQHERVKFVDARSHPGVVTRFAGLGKHGDAKYRRATLLHDAGFGAEPRMVRNGLLTTSWIDGPSLRARTRASADTVARVAGYIGFVGRTFRLDDTDDGEELAEMVRHNSRSALAAGDVSALEALIAAPRGAAPRVAVDGRMLRHEWIRGSQGLMKVDALDHHADDFLPGCRDIAWDVAGACVDLRLEPVAQQELVSAYVQASGDRHVRERLRFFTAAYLAYRLGYTTMAAEALGGSPDGERFTRARERYRRLLAAHAAHLRQSAGR